MSDREWQIGDRSPLPIYDPRDAQQSPADFSDHDVLDLGAWFIVRTSVSGTLRLADCLRGFGFDAWTPVERTVRRTRRKRHPEDVSRPMMATYVFIRVEYLDELRGLSHQKRTTMPSFRVFKFEGGIPLIADCELGFLRQLESRKLTLFERMKLKQRPMPVIEPGTEVNMDDGCFAGLPGRVEKQEGSFTLVAFEGFQQPIKISSLLLSENV